MYSFLIIYHMSYNQNHRHNSDYQLYFNIGHPNIILSTMLCYMKDNKECQYQCRFDSYNIQIKMVQNKQHNLHGKQHKDYLIFFHNIHQDIQLSIYRYDDNMISLQHLYSFDNGFNYLHKWHKIHDIQHRNILLSLINILLEDNLMCITKFLFFCNKYLKDYQYLSHSFDILEDYYLYM